jgi:alkylation response protein AidB-like acyl-CoA dehydrogenase
VGLELNDEQNLLKESVDNLTSREYTFEQRRDALARGVMMRDDIWAQFAELGWLGAGLPESLGGFGGNAVEHMVIAEGLGRAMALEPFISTAVMGGRALTIADDPARAQVIADDLIAGNWRCAVACAEQGGRYDLHHVDCRAVLDGNAVTLTGTKIAVLDAGSATHFLVAARHNGDTRSKDGIGLYLVDRNTNGAELESYQTMDGTYAGTLALDGVEAEQLVSPERGLSALEDIVQRGIAARCAAATGAMDASFGQTVEYMKSREQFGQTLGSFQVIQHRLVDLLMCVRECQSTILMVANQVGDSDAEARAKAVSGAKVFVGRRARKLAQEIVQLHGGIGMTEELAIGHFFRYLTLFCSTLGSTEHHLERVAGSV